MNIADVRRGERGFSVTWNDRAVVEYPYIWLRDNDPGELHPETRERLFDLTTVELDIEPVGFSVTARGLRVDWPQKEASSVYPCDWLRRHQPGRKRADAAVVEKASWDREMLGALPRCSMPACSSKKNVLLEALQQLKRFGLLLVEDLEDTPDASAAFAELIGFRRRTNFGELFEVISKPEPNNLAYTALGLPLHTDLPNQEIIPGYQVLHCYKNSASGGESLFADGLCISEDLRTESPEDFELLRTIRVPWRFHDANNDIRRHRPVINLDDAGKLDYFVFNAHIADIPDMQADLLYDFYAAYKQLMNRIRDPRYAVHYLLQPGEMVVFDNARVLHGRAEFDPNSGERQLYGYYVERNEVDSRIRVLARS